MVRTGESLPTPTGLPVAPTQPRELRRFSRARVTSVSELPWLSAQNAAWAGSQLPVATAGRPLPQEDRDTGGGQSGRT